MKYSISLTFLVLWLAMPVWSQTASPHTPSGTSTPTGSQPAPHPTQAAAVTLNLRPIDTHFSTIGGMSYVMDDQELRSYQDFQEVISPLKDYEAQRLLDRSVTTDDLARIFKIAGLAAVVTGVVGVGTDSNSDNQVPFLITALSGAVMVDVGIFFESESQTTKYNAVQRYNRFAYGREQVLPQAPPDEKSLLPIAGQAATATPEPKAN